MKTIIAGSRGATMDDVWTAMDNCPWEVTSVVSGCARGADKFGERWAAMEGLNVHHFPADWDKHGKGAGHIRNKEMAENADACVVVWDGRSRGSNHMIEQAKDNKMRLCIWYYDGPARTFQADMPHAVAGALEQSGYIIDAAPILKGFIGESLHKLIAYVVGKNGTIIEVDN